MRANLRKWIPIGLCCVPAVGVAAIVGIGIASGGAAIGTSFGGPLGLGLIALAVLACPLSMGLMMMRRGSPRASTLGAGSSEAMADCCAPGEVRAASGVGSSVDRSAALRDRRETLEREIAELQKATRA